MKHLVAILLDTDTEPHRVKISHHKNVFFDPSDNVKQAELLSKDINTMATGIVMAIREGEQRGVMNAIDTRENLINYLRAALSNLDLPNPSASGIVIGDVNIAR